MKGKKSSFSSDMIKLAVGSEFDELFQGLRLDLKEVYNFVLGDVECKPDKGRSAYQTMKSFGYSGGAAYDHISKRLDATDVFCKPDCINEHVKVPARVRVMTGKLLEKMCDAVMKLYPGYFKDQKRNEMYADKLCQQWGGSFAFEGFSWLLTAVGGNAIGTLHRHIDEYDDFREGYNVTAVASFIIVVNNILVRLSLIGYCRASCGSHYEKYCGFASELFDLIKDYVESKRSGILYEQFELPSNDDERWKEVSDANSSVESDKVKVLLLEPFLVRDGYFSVFGFCHRWVSDALGFDKIDKFEWFYAMSLVNGPAKMWFVSQKWVKQNQIKVKG